MTDRVIVQGESNIEVIKHRIYEEQGQHLTSHIVTSNVDNLTKGVEFDHLLMLRLLSTSLDGLKLLK